MSELLLELFSEEIPARMQARAAADLQRLVVEGLTERGLILGPAESFATPRRLALVIDNVPAASPAQSEERKGPRVGAPEAAVQGFLKSAGLASLADAEVVSDGKKGDYYFARISRTGRPAAQIVAETVTAVVERFPWPKSMRTADKRLTWVRPLHRIVCLLGGKVVPFAIDGIESGNVTEGHRFLAAKPFTIKDFADYRVKLADAYVILDPADRSAKIAEQARALAEARDLSLVEDVALLAENAGLTEWPTVLMGAFEPEFLDVPAEVLTTAMRTHQKCFSLRDPATGKLANRFLLTANIVPKDGGAVIVAGNEKVIRARLSDARFFWEQDLKRPLDEMASALRGITFHEKLGSQWDRVERIAELAHEIAPAVDADPEDARRAAQLAKADLVSGMVGEFPELQGLMGRYYAEAGGIKPETARAIELHYKPKGPSDSVPLEEEGDAVAVAVALADKLDTLVGFWAIGEKPTGSGDPYQLRRAALGVIRIVLENDLRLPLLGRPDASGRLGGALEIASDLYEDRLEDLYPGHKERRQVERGRIAATGRTPFPDLLFFFLERLKVYLREQGSRHDLIDAVFLLPGQDDLALIVKRVEALGAFLATDDGASLLAGTKRAANILAIEEKKDKRAYDGAPEGSLLAEPAERGLAAAIAKVRFDAQAAINVENFAGAMRALAELRGPVDAFFEKVTVNVPEPMLRENRLKLLAEIRAVTLLVADFSKIAG